MTHVGILTWDWRGHPNIDELDRIIANLTNLRVRVRAVDTGGDEYAIAISTDELDDDLATEAYQRWEASRDTFVEVGERPASCTEPVWDGPYRMDCGRRIVDNACGRHGKVAS